ncbi:MAG: winged helix-turn-helix transcriptional regulator [Thermodesulfobacteriota bacterium]|nr:winged helix-turn-helix transcriptional regulator [Thermodesulfobacteriota bacterium]
MELLDNKSLQTLRILDEVAKGGAVTQRDLSKKLGVALGLINNYMRRLGKQGYIQITHVERKRLHYLVTPKGIAEKSILAYKYVQRSYQVFNEMRQRMREGFEKLAQEGVKSVVLYKANVEAEIAYLALLDVGLELVAVIDESRPGEKFLGLTIQSPEMLTGLAFNTIVVTSADSIDKIKMLVKQYRIEGKKICLSI